MSDESTAPAGDTVSYAVPADAPAEMSVSDAARMLSKARQKQAEPPAESAPEATAETPELPVEATSDPVTDPAETTDEPDPAELPPIERPRSWAKDLDEEWASYPREAQEKIAKREQERDAAIRRSQNEAADARKAAEAQQAAADKAKQQYEAQLPTLMRELENVTQQNFHDIKTMDDVVKLQAEDPFRFQAWQVHQMRLQAAKVESDRVQNETAQSKHTKRATYEAEQNKLLRELLPDMADPAKAAPLRERAVKMLTDPDDDIRLTNDQLTRWMADDTGHEILSHAGIQKLIADRLKYQDMLAAPKAIAAKPLPPVQKPGVAKAGASSPTAQIQTIQQQLNTATGDRALQLAAQLTRLKRAGSR